MALREGIPGTIYRADYQPPEFGVSTVNLEVKIFDGRTEVIHISASLEGRVNRKKVLFIPKRKKIYRLF